MSEIVTNSMFNLKCTRKIYDHCIKTLLIRSLLYVYIILITLLHPKMAVNVPMYYLPIMQPLSAKDQTRAFSIQVRAANQLSH